MLNTNQRELESVMLKKSKDNDLASDLSASLMSILPPTMTEIKYSVSAIIELPNQDKNSGSFK